MNDGQPSQRRLFSSLSGCRALSRKVNARVRAFLVAMLFCRLSNTDNTRQRSGSTKKAIGGHSWVTY